MLFGAQAVGLALAAAVWLLASGAFPTGSVFALATGAGLAELVGFALLYRGLAVGEMSLVAPLAALTALLPILVAVTGGERIAALQICGIVLALLGTLLAASEPGHRRLARGAGLGLAAAVAFGVFLVGLGEASEHAGPGAVLVGRLASVAALRRCSACAARRSPPRAWTLATSPPSAPSTSSPALPTRSPRRAAATRSSLCSPRRTRSPRSC